MEIKKADSKGRVSGFTPGVYYEIYETDDKTYFSIYQYAFSGRDDDKLNRDPRRKEPE